MCSEESEKEELSPVGHLEGQGGFLGPDDKVLVGTGQKNLQMWLGRWHFTEWLS